MGSKLPTDLFPSPNGESQDAKLGNEGRQLRSRLVETCKLCGRPLSAVAGKSSASHIPCACTTPPGPSTAPDFAPATSPRKKKMHHKVGDTSKRQLFKDTSPSASVQPPQIVDSELGGDGGDGGECSTAFASAEEQRPEYEQPVKIEVKSEEDEGGGSGSGSGNAARRATTSRSRHPCTRCPKSFNTPGKLNQHMFSHTGEKPFVCCHCGKAFSSKFKLVRHLLIHSDDKQYRCTMCERTFHRKDHLKNHSKVHSPVKRRYTCDRAECKKEYSSVLSYRKHMAVHSAQEGNLECKICQRQCGSKEEIMNHLKVHAGSRSFKTPADRKYRCDFCPRAFFTGKDVRRHSVVHTGRRDFLCQYCPQRFGRKDHLTRHIKKSHSNSAKKVKTKRTADPEKSKSIGNILQEMFDKKTAMTAVASTSAAVASTSQAPSTEPQSSLSQSVADDLYKMQGLDSPVDVTKLESSPDIVPIVAMDDKSVLQTKVEHNLGLYDMIENIPFTKYEPYPHHHHHHHHHPYGAFPVPAYSQPGPSTSTMMPDLMGYEPQQPPPYATGLAGAFDHESVQVKTEVEYSPQVDEASTLDLVLPPITNIASSVGDCLLSNAELQNFLTTQHGDGAEGGDGTDENDGDRNSNIDDQLLNLLPNLQNSELLASLLDPQANTDPLPHFDQAFHHSP